MLKRVLAAISISVAGLFIVMSVLSAQAVMAQGTRGLVPYPRDMVSVETIDPMTRMPRNTFCIGVNTIDVKLTNNDGYRRFVTVVNRDTRGIERTLYSGWLEPGTQYLSALMRTQLELTGPAGTETIRVDVNEYGQGAVPGSWVSFSVQDCGGQFPGGGGGYGYAQLWARVVPSAIEQGKKGTIVLQAGVESRTNMTYYFEIMNSWNQLWKRIPVSKRPYERYQVTLPVGESTKPGVLTYTVNLWLESGFTGERRKVASTGFSFRVVTPGTYVPSYPSGYPGWTPYSGNPSWGTPGYGQSPSYGSPSYGYGMYPYDMSFYGSGGYPGGFMDERQIQ